MHDLSMTHRIAEAVAAQGGRVYFVGGFVRDRLMGSESKDVDIEVHGITPDALEQILDTLGERMSLGESFGIYALKGYGIDIALPRSEKPCGRGHRDFEIHVDPFCGTRKAAARRDFTVNALMQDVLTGEIIDEFGGRADLEKGVLRHVRDGTFTEDALRVLRLAQFAARFGFTAAPETAALCRTMSLRCLAKERVLGEVEKALCKADRPSVFFALLRAIGQLDVWFPELQALIGVPQPPQYHAEGDVWTHTMLVLDAAATLRDRVCDPLSFMLAAAAHDMGKAVCTEIRDGAIHAYDHETKGLPIVETFIRRLTNEREVLSRVQNLTALHMKPNILAAAHAGIKATNRMFARACDPEALIALALADGRGQLPHAPDNEAFLRERLEMYRQTMAQPYVMGRDLIAAGLAAGPEFSRYLDYAHKLRLAGVDKPSALKQTLAFARKNGGKYV